MNLSQHGYQSQCRIGKLTADVMPLCALLSANSLRFQDALRRDQLTERISIRPGATYCP